MNARHLIILAGALVCATAAHAQFGLDLSKVNKAITDAKKVTDSATEGAKVVKGVVGIGAAEERKIGEATALELISRFGGVLRDDDAMRRVNLVGRALAQYSSRPSLDWQFAVLDSDTVNAFSAPGGLVFITRGLYEQTLGSDDLLAGVLGHEIAHITNKNALKIISRGEALTAGKKLAVQYDQNARELDSQVNQLNAQVGSLLGFDVRNLTKQMVEKGFDAPTEYTADRDGRALAVLTGYAPGGLRAVLANLKTDNKKQAKAFSSHPPLADRLKKLPSDPAPAPPADAKDQPGGEAK